MSTETDVSPFGELISSTDKADMVGNTNRWHKCKHRLWSDCSMWHVPKSMQFKIMKLQIKSVHVT